jgi:hypothetical protein
MQAIMLRLIMAANKQIYIPEIRIKGSFMEEIGSVEDKVMYPGQAFDVSLSADDFENAEEYHTAWISITKAVKTKLKKHAQVRAS